MSNSSINANTLLSRSYLLRFAPAFIIFISIQLILSFYLKDAFWHPSKYVYTYGGDGAFVYFNLIFHSFFGDGLMLKNMNYPHFESLFMTDSQASVGLFFSMINDIVPNFLTPEKIIGLSHRFHYLMLGVAGIYIYKSLTILKIKEWISIPASVLIILLSPLMIRLTAGHFGLAYPFVFAFVFYFMLQYFNKEKIAVSPVFGLILTLLVFGLNNFYIGLINVTVLGLVAFYFLFFKQSRSKAILLLGLSIGIATILYGFIHFTDPGADRINIQWGYFANSVDLSSFVFPHTSLLNKIISNFSEIKNFGGETWVNLGLVPLLLLICAPLLLWMNKKNEAEKSNNKLIIQSFTFASFVLLLYSSALFYRVPFLQELFFHKFGILTMFKASGRFAWPIYFFAAMMAVVYFQKFYQSITKKNALFGIIFSVSAFAVWFFETHLYLNNFVFTQLHANPYNSEKKDEILNTLLSNDIDYNQFQAMYSVPVMEGWNDKFQIVPHFNSEFNSILISMSTGLPMINGMLSRIGVTDASKAIQLSSNPLIVKELVSELNSEKPILLVLGNGAENLTVGEKSLISKGTLIAEAKDYKLFSIFSKTMNDYPTRDSIILKYQSLQDTIFDTKNAFFVNENYDEGGNEFAFAGKSSKQIVEKRELINIELPDSVSGQYECSVYVKLDSKMYGLPNFSLRLYGKDQIEIGNATFTPAQSKDNQNGWIRASKIFEIPAGCSRLNLEISGINQNFMIDELCIRSLNSDLVKMNAFENQLLYNNFKLDLNTLEN